MSKLNEVDKLIMSADSTFFVDASIADYPHILSAAELNVSGVTFAIVLPLHLN